MCDDNNKKIAYVMWEVPAPAPNVTIPLVYKHDSGGFPVYLICMHKCHS